MLLSLNTVGRGYRYRPSMTTFPTSGGLLHFLRTYFPQTTSVSSYSPLVEEHSISLTLKYTASVLTTKKALQFHDYFPQRNKEPRSDYTLPHYTQ